MYRLHIDIPLGEDQNNSIVRSNDIVNRIKDILKEHNLVGCGDIMQYRLGEDTDRQPSNYLQINANGHCSNKKIRVEF